MKPFHIKWVSGVLLIIMSALRLHAQSDTLCNPNENLKIFGELYFNYGSVTNSYSQFNRATYVVGQPLVSKQAMLSQDNQGGFGVYSPWYLPPQPPVLVATQGDFKDRIRLAWNVNPLSPAPTGFVIYRDGSYLTDVGEDVRQFLDFNVQAGEYYEYSIIASNVYGEGSEYKSVGFVNPNGVISGVVQTNSTNPVPGVTVRLTPLTGKALYFHGDNDQVCASYKDALPTDAFTVSTYVKLDATVADGAGVIDWGSTLQSNWWITAVNDGGDRGFDFHIGDGTNTKTIRHILPTVINPFNGTQWHQITMTFTGTMMTVYIDGVFIETTSATISRVKNRLSVGSLVDNDHYFKGYIDDLRIYNRVLTQSELMETKNRTVASSEAGLVMYWKFDEGIGEKIFDISKSKINGVLYGFNATGLLGPTFSDDIPEVYNSGVTDVSGFYIIDGVNYSDVEQFQVTPMKDFYYNTGLEFASFKSSCATLTDYALPAQSTIDFSFYPFDLQSTQMLLSKGSKVQVYLEGGHLKLQLNYGTTVDMGAITSKYHTLSIALDNETGMATIYIDGDPNTKVEVNFTAISDWLGEPWILGSTMCPGGTDYFTGLIDEFTVFEGLLPQQYVEQNYVTGTPATAYNEYKLVPNAIDNNIIDTVYYYYPIFSRFDLNEASGSEIVDYAALNDTTINAYRSGSVTNTTWTNNVRLSEDVPHEFEPNARIANLNTSNTAIGNIDFKDVSTVNVSGYVRFANTFCFEDQVEILVNNESHFPPIFTDSEGKWSAEFEPGKNIKLKAVYKDHLFSPSFIEFRKLQAPKAGVVFLDNTKRTIRGQVAGGECFKSIIPEGSRVVVKVATLDGCFERTDTLRNPDGKFVFSNLPARAFRVSVVEHSNSVIYNYLQLKGGQETDLRDKGADTLNFIYIAPPNVEIEPFPAIVCEGGAEFRIIPQSQNEQSAKYKKKIQVYEQYNGGKCYVDNAVLTINNQIQGSDNETIQMDSTTYVYEFLAGVPNIISPYLKTMQVTAVVNGASATITDDVIVVGKRSRESTFTTEAPSDKPIWILRDPPGDGSFATLEAGSTKCTAHANSFVRNQSGSISGAVEMGKKIKTVVGGPGFATIEENGSVVTNTMKGSITYGGSSTSETEVCYTTTESYSTSDGDNIVGRMADVFIGTSMNFEYGINDMIYYDPESCSIKDTFGIWLDPKKFGTQYVYSRWQIMTDVIPSLETLGKSNEANLWRKILKEDEYYLVQKPGYANDINDIINRVIDILPVSSVIPNAILEPVKKIINSAVNSAEEGIRYATGANKDPDTVRYEAIFDKNVTFDGISNYTSTFSKEDTKASTTTWSLGADFTSTINGEVTIFGLDVNTTLETTTGGSYESTKGSSQTKTTTISYTLADDDPNDNFTVDIFKKGDLPLFNLKAGESMCPWEYGTLNREEVGFLADYTRQINVPENTPAVFPVHLQNLGQTGNDPLVFIIGAVANSNPRGAIISLNGLPLVEPVRIQLQPDEQVDLLITIEKCPIDYQYDILRIFFASECMFEHSLSLGYDLSKTLGYLVDETGIVPGFDNKKYNGLNSKFYKQLKLDAYFIEPCSTVDIGSPMQNFVVTPGVENKLSITLNEYNKADPDLKLIRLQYRPVGGDGSWINISETLKADLGEVFTIKEWNTELNKDGAYEIRAVAECFDVSLKPGISTVIRGTLEREPPELVGIPSPGDGTWDPGDEISITFNEPIDCDKVFQADQLANNTIGLYDATTNALVDATISCVGNKITIVPNINPVFFENRAFRVVVSGKDYDAAQLEQNPNHQAAAIRDKAGNMIETTIKWEFFVNQNNIEWVGADIIEVAEIFKPIVVKRQIRNRGGTIVNFTMNDIPSWLTVSPKTGALNPGQLADVTFTFQEDLLIGDYKATVKLSGSKGDEPLGIDYRVRCPAPAWAVDNPSQYSGSMNMVARLNIFGIESMDPSDIIVAYIDGEIRGVGKVQYFRQLDTDVLGSGWLAFITIFGDAIDDGKEILINVWDGDKCTQFAEVLEKFTFSDGEFLGSPVFPQDVHVVNLIQKCIPLNKGWNWISINLDLGDNSVTNVLSSLKNKQNAVIKDNEKFSKYYVENNLGWRNTLKTIKPEKRYMLYVDQKDTLCIKGMPYLSEAHPINIVRGWNWIGVVPQVGNSVTQALKGLTPLNGDIIKDQSRFAQYVAGIGWVGNLNYLEAPKGYLLNISNPGLLIYPTTNAAINEEIQLKKLDKANEGPLNFAHSQYSSTMNIVARIEGVDIELGDELRAYINGEFKGAVGGQYISSLQKNLFFLTAYHDDPEQMTFRIYKADRKKELALSGSVAYIGEGMAGLVMEPLVLRLVTTGDPAIPLYMNNRFIYAPADKVFSNVDVRSAHADSITCGLYSFNSSLPMGSQQAAEDCTPIAGQQNTMTGVIRVKYNERSNFITSNDLITFIDPITDSMVGCSEVEGIGADTLFNFSVAGGNGIDSTPVDLHYYSAYMDSTFILKKGIYYKKDKELGNLNAPYEVNFSPITISLMNLNTLVVTLVDSTWTGTYCIELFAMNCDNDFADGETTLCFSRVNSGDCVDIEVRAGTEDGTVVHAKTISSTAMINGLLTVHYLAGLEVELKPGFEVIQTGELIVEIVPCSEGN